jgi:hypothetical protein
MGKEKQSRLGCSIDQKSQPTLLFLSHMVIEPSIDRWDIPIYSAFTFPSGYWTIDRSMRSIRTPNLLFFSFPIRLSIDRSDIPVYSSFPFPSSYWRSTRCFCMLHACIHIPSKFLLHKLHNKGARSLPHIPHVTESSAHMRACTWPYLDEIHC